MRRRGRHRQYRNARAGSCESTGAGRRGRHRQYRNARAGSCESTGAGRRLRITVAAASAGLILPGLGLAAPASAAPARADAGAGAWHCSAGAHTLAPPGSHLYPDTGNGGYTSLHTLVHLVYNAPTNRFLPGNGVTLTDRATQCLASFSLDFERKSKNTKHGPDMTVRSVTVN